tara:strand:- start:139 stop:546 length:408 start_codon:yes stop_codon:yes gene_type:complete
MNQQEYQVKFHFGEKVIKQRDVFIAALFINLLITILVNVLKVSPIKLWAVVDSFGRHFKLNLINQIIIQSPELLDTRIKQDVTDAITSYKDMVEWDESPFPEPTWIDEKNGETPLGGTLGYSYDFTEKETNDEQR